MVYSNSQYVLTYEYFSDGENQFSGSVTLTFAAPKWTCVTSDSHFTFTVTCAKTLTNKEYVDAKATVAGIGCSTVTMSGIYSDLTSFSYNFVVQ